MATPETYDAIVVGSGATGGWVARPAGAPASGPGTDMPAMPGG